MSIEDDVALLERVPTLRLLGGASLRMLAIGSEQRDFARGDVLFNAGDDPITFTIPEARLGTDWEIVIDTETPRGDPKDAIGFLPKTKVEVAGHAIVVLRSRA